jgi:hypothetical protein
MIDFGFLFHVGTTSALRRCAAVGCVLAALPFPKAVFAGSRQAALSQALAFRDPRSIQCSSSREPGDTSGRGAWAVKNKKRLQAFFSAAAGRDIWSFTIARTIPIVAGKRQPCDAIAIRADGAYTNDARAHVLSRAGVRVDRQEWVGASDHLAWDGNSPVLSASGDRFMRVFSAFETPRASVEARVFPMTNLRICGHKPRLGLAVCAQGSATDA